VQVAMQHHEETCPLFFNAVATLPCEMQKS